MHIKEKKINNFYRILPAITLFVSILLSPFLFTYAEDDIDTGTTSNISAEESSDIPSDISGDIKGPIVLYGDSLTEGLEIYGFFPDTVHKGINSLNTISAGFYLKEIADMKPSKVFILIGINDLWDGEMSHEAIVNNYGKILNQLKELSPGTKIYVQSILPVTINGMENNPAVSNEIIDSMNEQLKKLTEETKVEYIDINPAFKDDSGNMCSNYSFDGVHILSTYYHIWTDILQKYMD